MRTRHGGRWVEGLGEPALPAGPVLAGEVTELLLCKLTWSSEGAPPSAEYTEVWRKDNYQDWGLNQQWSQTSGEYDDTEVSEGETYWYKVRWCALGYVPVSDWSNVVELYVPPS
jgi:hypothetical protein